MKRSPCDQRVARADLSADDHRRFVMDEATVDQQLQRLSGWERKGDRLAKAFVFDEFRSAMKFVGRVADAAVTVDDEVEIEVRSNRVKLAVVTPGSGSVTGTGVALAARVDRLTGDHHHPVGMAGP
jgi:4a-hydroxytetrahydrobiopterin dehydratase